VNKTRTRDNTTVLRRLKKRTRDFLEEQEKNGTIA
jgi:hypothetical protein